MYFLKKNPFSSFWSHPGWRRRIGQKVVTWVRHFFHILISFKHQIFLECCCSFSTKNVLKPKIVSVVTCSWKLSPWIPLETRFLNQKERSNQSHYHLINNRKDDRLILRFTVKPYILLKNVFHWIYSTFYKGKHGHDFFWPQRSWRLLEAKNTPPRPKISWRSWFIEKNI